MSGAGPSASDPRASPARGDPRPPTVEALVEYVGAMSGRPRFHMGNEALDRNVMERVRIAIRDARPLRHELTLDRNGFQLFDHATAFSDPRAAAAAQGPYRAELEQVLRAVTGATKVLTTPNGVVRLAERAPDFGAAGTTYPARQVHSDYTRTSGPALAQGLLSPQEARERRGKRFAIYSLWRAFSPPPQDVPLALCDAQSVAPEDVVLSDVVIGPPGRQIVFEGANFRHSPRHRWYYFRDLRRHELVMIKLYDSDETRAWRVPHTAFLDPSAPPGAPPRVSLEIRGVAFFDA